MGQTGGGYIVGGSEPVILDTRSCERAVRGISPPFAVELRASRESGTAMNPRVHFGRDAWQRVLHSPPGQRIVVPGILEADLALLDFSAIAGLDGVVLEAHDADLVLAQRVARRILEHDVRLVVMLIGQRPHAEFFYRSSADEAAAIVGVGKAMVQDAKVISTSVRAIEACA